ncbi:MAG: putative metal-dependent hydrolase [Flavobacteriaceae bacterium]|nr:putative metal-dependent hydrolase [Flavobacteriaceae bacterium]
MHNAQYPIGRFQMPADISSDAIEKAIVTISNFPKKLLELYSPLGEEQLQWTYRQGGWNIAQLIHHCADSHMNSFIRCKLALTEDKPYIKPYMENLWAQGTDYSPKTTSASLRILEGLHHRWSLLLRSLDQKEVRRMYIHPEHQSEFSLAQTILLYDWHCRHHLMHIEIAIQNQGQH